REMAHLNVIEKTTKSKMQRIMPPSSQDALRGQQQVAVNKLTKTIENKDLKAYHETASELLQDHDSITVIAAALKMLTKERRDTPVKLSSIQPVSVKKTQQNKGGNHGNKKRNYYG